MPASFLEKTGASRTQADFTFHFFVVPWSYPQVVGSARTARAGEIGRLPYVFVPALQATA